MKVEADAVRLHVGAVSATFDPLTGRLRQFQRGNKAVALTNGPQLVFAKPVVGRTGLATA